MGWPEVYSFRLKFTIWWPDWDWRAPVKRITLVLIVHDLVDAYQEQYTMMNGKRWLTGIVMLIAAGLLTLATGSALAQDETATCTLVAGLIVATSPDMKWT